MIGVLDAWLAFFQLLKDSAMVIVGVVLEELGVTDKVTVDVKEEVDDEDEDEDELETGSPSSSRSCSDSSACGMFLEVTP